ncbi:hypothetical protein BDY24DRAFT_246377 [Mrakia frigida]|uniref:uncharacterized protein n=1 Tax=Mrakia frigida TaxID=29902 RepID=UPI003FCBF48A
MAPSPPENPHAKLLRRSQSAGEALGSLLEVTEQQGSSLYEPYSDEDEESLHPSQSPQAYYSHKRGMSQISDHYLPVVVPQGPNKMVGGGGGAEQQQSTTSFQPPPWNAPPPPPQTQPPSFAYPSYPYPNQAQHLRHLTSSHQPYLAPSHPALQPSAQGSHHLSFTPLGHSLASQASPVNQQLQTPFTSSSFRPPMGAATRSQSTGVGRQRSMSLGGGLERAGTLLSHGVGPIRNGKELNRILGKGEDGRKVVGGANGKGEEDVRLEAGRRKGRVEIDVMLERDVMVEGGEVKGRMEVKVREWNKKEGDVYVGGGKVRVVGFEDLPSHNSRHIFYHHSHTLPLFQPNTTHRSSLFDASPSSPNPTSTTPDFRLAVSGTHDVPFFLPLPITNFPRGPFRSSQGSIKYILIASLKLFFPTTGKKSIAHFYRHVTIYPFLDVDRVLRNFEGAVEVEREKRASGNWGWGEKGKVELKVKSARGVWVAGQQCWLDVGVRNEGGKKINRLDIVLYQITTFYHPVPHLNMGSCIGADADTDAVQTASRRKKISETFLEAGQNGGRGYITGKGWWKGCEPKRSGSWGCGIQIPVS